MIPDQQLGQGDTLPAFQQQLINRDRSFVSLRPGDVVTCRVISPVCGRGVSETPAEIVDAPGGYVSHDWLDIETRDPGTLMVYFIVTKPNQDPIAYPWWGFYRVEVVARLA